MGLIPLLWLAWLHLRGERRDVAWWWLAGVFAVSWIADMAALWFDPWTASKVYPVSQAAIVGLVFLSRREALLLIVTLGLVGIGDVLLVGVGDFDLMLRTVAWLSVVGIVYPLRQLERLRIYLLTGFGLGWVAWLGYSINPGWGTWICYQLVRLIAIAMFCWASLRPTVKLRISA